MKIYPLLKSNSSPLTPSDAMADISSSSSRRKRTSVFVIGFVATIVVVVLSTLVVVMTMFDGDKIQLALTRSSSSSSSAAAADAIESNKIRNIKEYLTQQLLMSAYTTTTTTRRQRSLSETQRQQQQQKYQDMIDRFGPGANWDCTIKGATTYETCVDVGAGSTSTEIPKAAKEDEVVDGDDEKNDKEEKGSDDDKDGDGRRQRQLRKTGSILRRSLQRALEDVTNIDVIEEEEQEALEQGCAWCPLGDSTGLCVHSTQGSSINSFQLPHVKCYPPGNLDTDEDIQFFNKMLECTAKDSEGCSGSDTCTWCKTRMDTDPDIQFCTSKSFWEEMVTADEKEGNTKDGKIRLNQVFECGDVSSSSSSSSSNIFSTTCSKAVGIIRSKEDEDQCTKTLSSDGTTKCVVEQHPFPGVLGTKSGKHCMSKNQQTVSRWIVDLLEEMGWNVKEKTEERRRS